MNQISLQPGIAADLKAACDSQDIRKLKDVLQKVHSGFSDDVAKRLEALELQLRLGDFYLANRDSLQTLLQSIPQAEEELDRYRAQLLRFIEQFGNGLDACMQKEASEPFNPTALCAKLADTAQVPVLMEWLQSQAFRDKTWLTSRSRITKASVQDSVWSAAAEIEQYVAEIPAETSADLDDVREMQATVTQDLGVAIDELKIASNSLLPLATGAEV